MSNLFVDKISGKSGTSSGAPITLSGDTVTLGSGVTIPAAGITGVLPVGVTGGSGLDNPKITNIDVWRVSSGSSLLGALTPINLNFERDDSYAYVNLGTGMTQSSGTFLFPSTGIWWVQALVSASYTSTTSHWVLAIQYSSNGVGGSYSTSWEGGWSSWSGSARGHSSVTGVFDITNTTNQAIRFAIQSQQGSSTIFGNGGYNRNAFIFIRLSDT